jgi:hypothetical protein
MLNTVAMERVEIRVEAVVPVHFLRSFSVAIVKRLHDIGVLKRARD